MLDAGIIMMDGTNTVADPVRFTSHQGRRIDRSKLRSITGISSNYENDFEDRAAKWL